MMIYWSNFKLSTSPGRKTCQTPSYSTQILHAIQILRLVEIYNRCETSIEMILVRWTDQWHTAPLHKSNFGKKYIYAEIQLEVAPT